MTALFDSITRTYLGPSNNQENRFDYYNRSARKDVTIVRDKLEEWYANIPDSEKKEIKERFKKSFDAVFYEVFLFQLFKNLGFEIAFHPKIPGTDKKPDFLIKKDKLEIYVEAKISKDLSQEEEASERRLNQFYDSLNKVKTENFMLNVESINIKTAQQPPAKKLIKYLEDELAKLNPDLIEVILKSGGIEFLPQIKYSDDNIDIIVKPLPVNEDARGKIERAIGMFPYESILGGAEDSLQESINVKAKRYGILDKPYIICINALSEKTTSSFDIENAIWGSLAVSFSSDPANHNIKHFRQPDGIFLNKKGKRLLNVSGVLVTRVFPHNIPSANYWLFKHPFSENTFDFDELGLKYNYIEDNIIKKIVGDNLDVILKIEKNWIDEAIEKL